MYSRSSLADTVTFVPAGIDTLPARYAQSAESVSDERLPRRVSLTRTVPLCAASAPGIAPGRQPTSSSSANSSAIVRRNHALQSYFVIIPCTSEMSLCRTMPVLIIADVCDINPVFQVYCQNIFK